jgi:transcriptional regulator of nitric oxide reductase
MVARTKVARTRLTPDEHAQLVAQAAEAGVNPSEYLRGLIVDSSVRALGARVEACERRLEHLETQAAKKWLEAQ